MKTMKYVLLGVAFAAIGTPVMAQDNKAVIDEISKVIKSNPADVADQVKAVYKKNKKNAEVLVGIGRAYLEVKDTANAVIYADYGMKMKYGPAYMLRGDIYVLGENGNDAAVMYEQAIYFDPKNPEPYYKYASVYRKVSPAGAVAKLEELRAQRPDVAVDALAGRIYYQSNDFDQAIASFKKADFDKMELRDVRSFAMAYYLTQKYSESLDIAKKALSKEPRDAGFNRLAFFSNTDLKNYDEALQYADALFHRSDSVKFSYYDYTYYGNALNGAKKYDEAIAAFQQALAQEFDSKDKRAGVIKTLSEAYSSQDKYAEAIKYYQEYLQEYSTPTATDYAGLPQLYYYQASKQTGDEMIASLGQADTLYAQLAEKYPDAVEYATFWRARVNNAKDNDQQNGYAKPFYEKLIELYSSRTELGKADISRLKESYLYLISYEARVANNFDAAKEHAVKLLEIDPENAVAKQVIEAAK